jgi:hypothetical protein
MGVAVLVALAWMGFARTSGGRTRFGVTSYEVLSDSRVRIRFDVRKNSSASLTCALVARSRDHANVGQADVEVGPSARDVVRVTEVLTTTARASTVEVSGCSRARVADPPP